MPLSQATTKLQKFLPHHCHHQKEQVRLASPCEYLPQVRKRSIFWCKFGHCCFRENFACYQFKSCHARAQCALCACIVRAEHDGQSCISPIIWRFLVCALPAEQSASMWMVYCGHRSSQQWSLGRLFVTIVFLKQLSDSPRLGKKYSDLQNQRM